MNSKKNTLAILLFLSVSITTYASSIKHILFDVNVLIQTSTTKASNFVGVINSMKYTTMLGKIPSKADFFKALEQVPAQANQLTYYEDLIMPRILSDWFLGLESNSTILSTIFHYLDKSNMTRVEKTIFKNVSSMMMTPSVFISTQYIVTEFSKILHKLKKLGHRIYIVGNWDKESHALLMKMMQGKGLPEKDFCYFSHESQQIKPHPLFFDRFLQKYNLKREDCVIIEIEKNHAQIERKQGFNTVLLHNSSAMQLKSKLAQVGIHV